MADIASPTGAPGWAEAPRRPSRRRRVKPYLLVLLGLLLVVGGLVAVKAAQISRLVAFGKQAQKAGPPPETVSSAVAQEQAWDETIRSVGSVAAARGVTISNDAPGLVSRILFESGATVREGQVLVELDTRVERAQLASARARRALAATSAERSRALVASGAVTQAQLDNDESQLAAAAADERALAAQIERKVVRAPFAGKLGIRLVNVGQYLAPGTPVTDLQSKESTYVDFALPQQEIGTVSVGMRVRMSLDAREAGSAPPTAEGAVFAVEPAVDPSTRNVRVRATVPGDVDWLRPGMFVNVSVVGPKKTTVVAVPSTAVVHASFGDSVFVIEDEKDQEGHVVEGPGGQPSKVVRQQFVRLGPTTGDFVSVTDGLKVGEEVVTAGAFKLRNRGRVVVNNEVQANPERSPRPENR